MIILTYFKVIEIGEKIAFLNNYLQSFYLSQWDIQVLSNS